MGRDGYLAGSSWADAGTIAAAMKAINPRHVPIRYLPISHLPIREYRAGVLMEFDLSRCGRRKNNDGCISKRRDVDVQHGGLAVVECGQTAVDRAGEIVRCGDALAICAEGACDAGK